ncbi:MAG: thymidine phosphorylase [bacterium]|nr:thymidine phosphorylase [bacterium]
MNIIDVINKKKNKLELSYDELAFAFNGYLEKQIPDYQMSALLMAITINGMSYEETINLTDIFIKSGEVYHFDKDVCDKHSTGGVGDTVTLVAMPIVASLGVCCAKMSGRGLGITGGTIDKLESIPGFRTNLTKEEFYDVFNHTGLVVSSQTDDLVPLDKVIYALRDVTGTTESIPLIASSIMSKKIACGAKYVVIDVKCGDGALVKTRDDADKLSLWLQKIGESFGVSVRCLVTDMNEPLGNCVGNAIEVLNAIDVLKNNINCKLRDVSVEVASAIIEMARKVSEEEATKLVLDAISSGKAFDKFKEWISYQGGNLDDLKLDENTVYIKAKKDGIIKKIDALKVGKLASYLGAGRKNKEDKIDYGAGVKILVSDGDMVKTDQELAVLYVKDQNIKLDDELLDIFEIDETN